MSKTYIHPKVFAAMAALCVGLMAAPAVTADHDGRSIAVCSSEDRPSEDPDAVACMTKLAAFCNNQLGRPGDDYPTPAHCWADHIE